MTFPIKAEYVIIGAGIHGLSTAWHLAAKLKAKGEEIDVGKEKELLKTITERYNKQTSPYYAASRLWVDAVIDPLDTRKIISIGIEAANHSPIKKAYNPGIIQS